RSPMGARGMGALALAALASILAAAQGPSPVEDDSGLLGPPKVDGRPVEVTVGFYILDYARITSRDESFDATGYLELKWKEPRLALEPGARPGPWRRLDPRRIWVPRVYFENALEQPKTHNEPVVEVDDSGTVTSWTIVSGKFSSPMELYRFPFDRLVTH